MNEITRIHIAKIAYDTELAAKKQLEKYLQALETYAQDDEVVMDIEIRITELLESRGVKAGGVITSEDITAIRTQLGEPHEFADDAGDIAIGPSTLSSDRRLYRSLDSAVLGGVLSGVAQYFRINPLWTRLAFLVLLFISFGFVALLYIVLWVVIPPARTAAEKLQLSGQPVTAASIKALTMAESGESANRVAPLLQSVLLIGGGILSTLGAIGVFIAAAAVAFNEWGYSLDMPSLTRYFYGTDSTAMWVGHVITALIVAGLLMLSSLLSLVAYAFFKRKLTKKLVISSIIIIVLGVSSAVTVLVVGGLQASRATQEVQQMKVVKKEALPKDFAKITSLKFETQHPSRQKPIQFPAYPVIRYVVDNGPARYELTSLPSTKVVTTIQDTQATIRLDVADVYQNRFFSPELVIYGPAVTTLSNDANDVRYEGKGQDTIEITSTEEATLNASGSYQKVSVKGAGFVGLDDSTIQSLSVNSEQKLRVYAGTVRELAVTQPDVCPSYMDHDKVVRVTAVASGTMVVNGKAQPAQTQRTNCASVWIGSIEDY